jgi:hypothetical protein
MNGTSVIIFSKRREADAMLLINILAFQIAWFSSVLGGAHQMPWLGPLAVAIALMLHLRAARRPFDEILLAICCALIGALFDSALVALGWVGYTSGLFAENFAPYWIITMWVLFATTLNVSMKWMRGSPLLAAFFGVTGGPTTYLAGKELGGIVLINETAALIALGIGWGIMMPLLVSLSERLDGMPGPRRVWLAKTT